MAWFREHFGSRWVTVAAIALSVYLTLAGSDGPYPWSPFPRPLAVAAGLIGSLALWWWPTRPVEVAAVNVAAVALSANPVPAVVALYTLAASRRAALPLAAISGAAVVAFAVPEWVDAGKVSVSPLVGGFFATLVAVGAGLYVRTRHDLVRSLRDRAEAAEAERELRAEQAQLAERARIAREMHDVLAHKVSLIALHAGALEVNPDAGAARVEEVSGVIRVTAGQALEELRAVLGLLRDGDGAADDLAPPPQLADIARLVESSRAAGLDVSYRAEVAALPDGIARAAYRVVQEALTNVHKHAPGAPTSVTLTGDEGTGVTVTVENGPPPAPAAPALPGSGAGLVGLGERVRLLGGRLDAQPTEGGGWRLVAWIPWAAAP
jgi:signal transduction histidine kinase